MYGDGWNATVVHQRVHRQAAPFDLVEQPLRRARAREVRRQYGRPASRALDTRREGRQPIHRARHKHHVRALRRHRQRQCLANAGRGTSHDRHLPHSVSLHALSSTNPLSAATTAWGASSGASCPHEGTISSVALSTAV